LQEYHKSSNVTYDPTNTALSTDNVQYAMDEFANKPLAAPVQETSPAVVSTSYYQITATDDAYVGVPGEDINAVFAVYDVNDYELPITITAITEDQAGTIPVSGQTWHNQPYIHFSTPPNQQIMIKYGTKTTLAALPINAFLKEGVIVAEVDSDVTGYIAEIKGTAYDVVVPSTRNLVGLDARITAMTPFLHTHIYSATPVGALDGANATFTLPGGDTYVGGTLEVFLNGTKLPSAAVNEATPTTFQILVQIEQLPDAAVNDTLEVNYILGP
jgi:hypothetical protein